jgi:diguanylate cyclase (GGDEF)-like protein
MKLALEDLEERERLLVVGVPDRLAEALRRRYSLYEVVSRPDFLSGIAELGRGPVAAVLVQMPPTERRAESVAAGFRSALRNGVRLILCCEPAAEPTTRRALKAGADDYLIYPPTAEELDAGLGLVPSEAEVGTAEPTAEGVSFDELRELGDLLGGAGGSMRELADRVAAFLQRSLRAAGVRVEFGTLRAVAGETADEPVLIESISSDPKVSGRVLIGPRPKIPYDRADVEKLRVYAGLISNLFAAARQRQDWQRQALTDDLSGLRNRRYLVRALAHLLKRAESERFRVTLLIFDIDDFKRYNDAWGHSVGDELIREIGRLFTACCRRHDIVTRLGGDEFAVVFWDAEQPREAGSQHPADALAVLERFREELGNRQWQTLGAEARGSLTISGGLASFPWDARSPDELLRKADHALLQAKSHGKNRFYLVGGGQQIPPDDEERST